MKIYVFTTKTLHHYFFLKKISEKLKIEKIFYKIDKIKFKFDTSNPYENYENQFETKYFNVTKSDIEKINQIQFEEINNINNLDLEFLHNQNNNLGIVFGCRKISKKLFSKFNLGMLNVHRGLTQYYRGLDSDYWPIYFNDFKNLGTTIHLIDENLDTGDILYQKKININNETKIYQLKALTTNIAVKGFLSILDNYSLSKKNAQKLNDKGKYFSAMERVKKIACEKNLANYLSSKNA